MVMGIDLLSIMAEQVADENSPVIGRLPPPVACPNDGTPLLGGPGTDPTVELFCPFDGWQFPRDWVRPESNYGLS